MVRNMNFRCCAVFTSKQGLQLLFNRKVPSVLVYLFNFGMAYLVLDTGQWYYFGFLLWEQVQATGEVWSRVGGFGVNLHSCEMRKVAANPAAFLYS